MLVRRKTVVHRRRAPACDGVRPAPTLPCGCYLHLQTTVTKSATRQCGRRCATYGKTLRQDTATRHCGKTLRQGNTAGAAERLSGRHCGHMRQGTTAKHCGRHYGKKTPRQDTAAKIHCGTVARKCDMWQESATCVMALRHATATKPKKEGVGGGVHDALRVLVISCGASSSS